MKYTIGELAEIIDGDRGSNYPKQDEFFDTGFCLFLNTGNVTKDGFSFDSVQFITEEKDGLLKKGRLQRGDIVYTTRGTVGNAAFYSSSVPYEHVRINSGMVILRCRDEIVDTRFLYQVLKSEYYRPFFKKYCTGSAQPQLPIKNLSTIALEIPDKESQIHIADILSAYDDLIENNQKQIKLLEEAAQRLYKEWFIDLRFPGYETTPVHDGVPEGWEITTTENAAAILRRGISPSYDENGDSTVINQKCIRQTIVDLSEARKQMKKYPDELNLQDGDTVICSTGDGTLGRVGQVFGKLDNTTLDSHVTLVRATSDIGAQLLFWTVKSQQEFLQGMGKGSTNQLELSRSVIQELPFILPDPKTRMAFEGLAQAIHNKIAVQNKQIIALQTARDRLLPKLMSGEIEV